MNRTLIYFALAGAAVVMQTVLMPLLLQGDYKPDLVLLLVVYLGLHEEQWRGGLIVYLMGWFFDGVGGAFPGLNGFILLAIFLAVRGIVTRVNTESSVLLLILVMAGTILQSALVAFALDFFRQDISVFSQIAWQLPVQLLLNFVAAFFFLRLAVWLQRTFLPRSNLPGLRKLDSRYES
mgnify:CR=1 FL=1